VQIKFEECCYNTDQNIFSSRLLSKNVNKTIIITAALCGCETWSLILREEYRQKVFEKSVLRRIFGTKKDEMVGG
jgi:hypothetical protein